MTAASEAVFDPEIRGMVLEGFVELDKAFAACFRQAKEKGELPATADPIVLSQLASATIHTIAIRARAGVPRKELEAIVKGAIDLMCARPDAGAGSIPAAAVDDILQRAARLEALDLAGDVFRDLVGIGVGRIVRRQHDLRVGPERTIGGQRLLREDIERGRAKRAVSRDRREYRPRSAIRRGRH